jgi:UDP-N-acetyl-D-galactosamine dehydrogenase
MISNKKSKIAIIGLGYVGLPLAVEFSKKYEVLGFDINSERISQLKNGFDKTCEIDNTVLKSLDQLEFSDEEEKLINFDVLVVTVPTPIDKFKVPDLKPLISATTLVAKYLKRGDVVIFESTVYPGCTEEDCVPILEFYSGLKYNVDFSCGYSPERINPGDKINTLIKIKKVTSGSNTITADFVDNLYGSIISAGTHKASSIKVAEASKAIENAQRDLNISFVNELALIFDRMGIDTSEVIEAASTKWNFLKFKPGLVGGHCIGVDPYYLAHKAESLGYYPQVILSGRRVNDYMGTFVAQKAIKLLIRSGNSIKGSKCLILGITFKENCPDIRNSKVIDIYSELIDYGLEVYVHDPFANKDEVFSTYGIKLTYELSCYDVIILAVAHDEFLKIDISLLKNEESSIIYDLKSILNRNIVSDRL